MSFSSEVKEELKDKELEFKEVKDDLDKAQKEYEEISKKVSEYQIKEIDNNFKNDLSKLVINRIFTISSSYHLSFHIFLNIF